MLKNRFLVPPADITAKTRFPARTKWFAGILLLNLILVFAALAAVESPDDQYLAIFSVVEQADSFSAKGQTNSAKAKYVQAQTALQNLKKTYPTWNTKVVSYRLNYVADKISALSQPVSIPDTSVDGGVSSSSKSEGKSAMPSSGPQVKVLDPGTEPRMVLRLHAKPGEKQKVNMTVKMTMGMGPVTAQGEAMKLPALKLTTSVLPKSVSEQGDIDYDVMIDEFDVADEAGSMPGMAEPMKASLKGVKGFTISCAISDRGFSKKAEAEVPSDADPGMRQSIEQLKESFLNAEMLLPEEAVGPGARWEVKQKVKSQGMTMDQTTTYNLVSSEGDILTVKSSSAQRAANQKIQNPMMQGIKADLTKFVGSGTATMTLDLGKILPVQAMVDNHTEMTMGINAGGQKQTMAMKMDINIRMETK